MTRAQAAVFPAALIGCLIVAWIATIAATSMPVLAATPDPTAIAPPTEVVQENQPEQQAEAAVAPVDVVADQAVEQPQAQPEQSSGECSLSGNVPEKITRWCGLIEKYAAETGLSVSLLAAVMAQESGGNPDAYSKSGAVGLMQVMPRDGLAASFTCINGPCFASRPTTDELLEPEFNMSYGAKMLAGLISRWGSVKDGLMHYGPANVGYYYADKVLAIQERYE